jgi:hypothetical protein
VVIGFRTGVATDLAATVALDAASESGVAPLLLVVLSQRRIVLGSDQRVVPRVGRSEDLEQPGTNRIDVP